MHGDAVRLIQEGAAKPFVLNGPIDENGRLTEKPRTFLPAGWKEEAWKPAAPEAIGLSTLTGLRDYVAAKRETFEADKLMLHVEQPHRVKLIAALEGEDMLYRRKTFAFSAAVVSGFRFAEFIDGESFQIALQTCFEPTPERENLRALVASIKESDVREVVDNGVAQQVTTAGGVVFTGRTDVPNPIPLKPYRTFREVAQPVSLFVIRLRPGRSKEDKPTIALFEGDGGAWRLEAIQNVAAWLRKEMKEIPVIA